MAASGDEFDHRKCRRREEYNARRQRSRSREVVVPLVGPRLLCHQQGLGGVISPSCCAGRPEVGWEQCVRLIEIEVITDRDVNVMPAALPE